MKIAAFLDGRPGHEKTDSRDYKGSSQRTEIEVFEIKLKTDLPAVIRQSLSIRDSLKILKNSGSGFDIVIGTGSKTHICVIIAKFLSKAKAVICMSPEKFFFLFLIFALSQSTTICLRIIMFSRQQGLLVSILTEDIMTRRQGLF